MQYTENCLYTIINVKTPNGCDMFPVKGAIFMSTYEHMGIPSHVFRYSVNFDDYMDWLRCWTHVASNRIIVKGSEDKQYVVESHIYDHVILAIESEK